MYSRMAMQLSEMSGPRIASTPYSASSFQICNTLCTDLGALDCLLRDDNGAIHDTGLVRFVEGQPEALIGDAIADGPTVES
jgi:hypothetical protein